MQEIQKCYYDKKHKSMTYLLNDKIFLNNKNFKFLRSIWKLDHQYIDFFSILCIIDKQVYHLKLSSVFKSIHFVFYVSLLKLYRKRKNASISQRSEIIDNKEQYFIEEILDECIYNKKKKYLVRWKNWELQNDTWESEKNIEKAMTLNVYLEKKMKWLYWFLVK